MNVTLKKTGTCVIELHYTDAARIAKLLDLVQAHFAIKLELEEAIGAGQYEFDIVEGRVVKLHIQHPAFILADEINAALTKGNP